MINESVLMVLKAAGLIALVKYKLATYGPVMNTAGFDDLEIAEDFIHDIGVDRNVIVIAEAYFILYCSYKLH